MERSNARTALIVTDAFLALSALAGSGGLLLGWMRPPLYLLQGSPFSDYTLPALILGGLVGYPALIGALALLNHESLALRASWLAGVAVIGFVTVESLVIGFELLQVVYLLVGVAILSLAIVQVAAVPAATRRWLTQ